MSDDILRVAALTVACLLGLWTAIACRRAQYQGLPGSDALVWAGLSGAFFLLSLMKTARGLGLLRGFGGVVRDIFKQRGWYEDRRSLQIAVSIAVAVVVMVLVVWGLLWAWHYIKRYRLAIGFAGLTVGFGIIRFISLHTKSMHGMRMRLGRAWSSISSPLLGYRRSPSPGSGS
jgi:hypothetical protein